MAHILLYAPVSIYGQMQPWLCYPSLLLQRLFCNNLLASKPHQYYIPDAPIPYHIAPGVVYTSPKLFYINSFILSYQINAKSNNIN